MDILTAPNEVTVSRKKLYCFARMYQALENTGSPFLGCDHCKISKGNTECPYDYADIKIWLKTLTGINLSIVGNENKLLEKEVPIGETYCY